MIGCDMRERYMQVEKCIDLCSNSGKCIKLENSLNMQFSSKLIKTNPINLFI